jgi:site-specific DNA-methyltransferase (cytosine-N4-specific)
VDFSEERMERPGVGEDMISILQAQAENIPLAEKSVDLVFGSPPYCDARTYGINAQRNCMEWVDWMLKVTTECMNISRGPVVWVAAGVTRDRNYWPACEGLMWEWWKRGGHYQLYRPCIYHRQGIPGSGQDDWFRSDWEYVMCFKDEGKLPWSDNTAMGHKPIYRAGGGCTNRSSSWIDKSRKADGRRRIKKYACPEISNPGNVISLGAIGGGKTGGKICHENEAPFPERLAEFFIRSLCPPGGTVLDPFSGSGTVAAVAEKFGRNSIAADIRYSQCEILKKRQHNLQRMMDGVA